MCSWCVKLWHYIYVNGYKVSSFNRFPMETLLPGLILHYDKCIYWNNNSGSQFKENKICWTFQESLWTHVSNALPNSSTELKPLHNYICWYVSLCWRNILYFLFFFYNLGVCEGPVIFQINWSQLQFVLSNRQNKTSG